jgi:2,3-bisphosphoglycerate-independent phosphoglycerate mutase
MYAIVNETEIVKEENTMRVLCIFLDGVGIGAADPAINPFAALPSDIFPVAIHAPAQVRFDGIAIPTDACLDVPGLPQSATGQTALLSGVNAARQLGGHVSGFATPRLIEILRRESVFVKVQQRGRTAAFANAYGRDFFQLSDRMRTRITSVTTAATMTAGLPFLLAENILEGRSLSHDFTNKALNRRGYNLPIFSPECAGKQLALLSQTYDFCLYEYFLTDRVGHLADFQLAFEEVEKLERFLTAVLEHTDLKSTAVVLCSDHGNLEDIAVITHTRNPVPTIVWGTGVRQVVDMIKRLTDVTPAMLNILDK